MDVWDATTGRLVNQLPRSEQPALLTALQVEIKRPVKLEAPPGGFGGNPSPPQRTTPEIIFSPDGSQLAAWEQDDPYREDGPAAPANSSGRLRIWNVESGEELAAPEIGLSLWLRPTPNSRFDEEPPISIEAGGVRWLELTSPPPARGLPENWGGPKITKNVDETSEPARSPEYVARYWDRASGQVTTQRFRPGDGTEMKYTDLIGRSQDGRILLFKLSRTDPHKYREPTGRQVTVPIECWNVAANPPKRIWSASRQTLPAWVSSAVLSGGGKMVAVRDDSGVTVYRTEGRAGEPIIEWRAEVPSQQKITREDRWTVFDDGQLVLYRTLGLALLSPEWRKGINGEDTMTTRPTFLYGTNNPPSVYLSKNGKKLFGVNHLAVRVWNLEESAACLRRVRRLRVEC